MAGRHNIPPRYDRGQRGERPPQQHQRQERHDRHGNRPDRHESDGAMPPQTIGIGPGTRLDDLYR